MAEDVAKTHGKKFPKGIVLFREGEPGQEMYVIHQGRVRISKQMGDVEKTLAVLGVGDFFGEMALLNGERRSAMATVVESSELLVLDAATFEKMVRDNAEIALRIIQALALRVKHANEQIANLLLSDPIMRVADFLIKESKTEALGSAKERLLLFGARELADRTGMKLNPTLQALRSLEEEKLLQIAEDALTITNLDELKHFFSLLEVKNKAEVPG